MSSKQNALGESRAKQYAGQSGIFEFLTDCGK